MSSPDIAQRKRRDEDGTCKTCQRIADFIIDFPSSTDDSIILGSWEKYQRRTKCATCQWIVRALEPRYQAAKVAGTTRLTLSHNKILACFRVRAPKYKTLYVDLQLFPASPRTMGSGQRGPTQYPVLYHRPVNPARIDLRRIVSWLRNCEQDHHGLCHKPHQMNVAARRRSSQKYLIDVFRHHIIKATGGENYVCLSYVWGEQHDALVLTKANRSYLSRPGVFHKLIADDALPETIIDAITVTRALDCRYLWVDRLCITQDDADELQAQIWCMDTIYARSSVTIIAADGANARSGLGRVNNRGRISTDSWHPAYLKFADRLVCQVSRPQEYPDRLLPWQTRAWTFQERYFSPRRLIFAYDTVLWECPNLEVWECFDNASGHHDLLKIVHAFPRTRYEPWPDLALYVDLVDAYTALQLTKDEDVENAFAGLLSTLGATFPGGFVAGLPCFAFEFAMTWAPWHRDAVILRREGFPSWSWFGWKGARMRYYRSYASTSPKSALSMIEPMVQWTLCHKANGETRPLRSGYHIYQSMRLEIPNTVPDGWRVETSSHSPRLGINLNSYTHESFPGKVFAHPLPVAAGPLSQASATPWYPFLCFSTQAGRLRARRITAYKGSGTLIALYSEAQEWCGSLFYDLSMAENQQQDQEMECELIVIAKGRCARDEEHNMHPEVVEMQYTEELAQSKLYEHYVVLSIAWVDGIAYRRGVGRCLQTAWNKQSFETRDIVLG